MGDFGFDKIKQLTGGGARIMNTPGEFSYTAPEMMRSVRNTCPQQPSDIPASIPAFSHPYAWHNIASLSCAEDWPS